MIISVFNFKGGVGKTSISFNIGSHYGLQFKENDPYGSLDILSGYEDTTLNYKDIKNDTLYDFAGFYDDNSYKVLLKSDIVLIPTLNSILDVKNTINSINYCKKYCKNILIVVNRYKKNENIEELITFIEKHTDIKEYVLLNESKGIQNALNMKKSIFTLANENNLNKHTYRNILGCFKNIIKKVDKLCMN